MFINVGPDADEMATLRFTFADIAATRQFEIKGVKNFRQTHFLKQDYFHEFY